MGYNLINKSYLSLKLKLVTQIYVLINNSPFPTSKKRQLLRGKKETITFLIFVIINLLSGKGYAICTIHETTNR